MVTYIDNEEVRSRDFHLQYELDAPKSLKISKTGANSTKLTWKSVKGAEKYIITRSTPYAGSYTMITSNTSIEDKGLTPGIQYQYKVTAVNNSIDPHSPGAAATGKVKMEVPVNEITSIKNNSGKKAVIKWNKMKAADQYVIYRANSKDGTYKKIATVNSSKTSYTDSDLTKGKTYYYKIVTKVKNRAAVMVSSKKSSAKKIKITK